MPKEERTCRHCESREVEDEYHFVMSCEKYKGLREDFISRIGDFTDFNSWSLNFKFNFIMWAGNGDLEFVNLISNYLNSIWKARF